jgi:hypothetical protein
VEGVVPLIGDTFSHVPGCRATENAAGPESLVTLIVCEAGVALKAGDVKLRLSGAAEITGTAVSVTVSDTGSVAGGRLLFIETTIEP